MYPIKGRCLALPPFLLYFHKVTQHDNGMYRIKILHSFDHSKALFFILPINVFTNHIVSVIVKINTYPYLCFLLYNILYLFFQLNSGFLHMNNHMKIFFKILFFIIFHTFLTVFLFGIIMVNQSYPRNFGIIC